MSPRTLVLTNFFVVEGNEGVEPVPVSAQVALPTGSRDDRDIQMRPERRCREIAAKKQRSGYMGYIKRSSCSHIEPANNKPMNIANPIRRQKETATVV